MILTNAIVTFYCACKLCCGKDDGITASGIKAREGVTVATSNYAIPFGTKVTWEGRTFIVQDRMHKKYSKQNKFDIYISDHKRAQRLGIKTKQTITIRVWKKE